MTRRMATVPIQFEPTPESPLTDSQTLSHVRKNRSVGACGAVYCVGAVAACPAFDQKSHAAHDAQDGKGIDSVRPEPGSPLDCRGQFVPYSQRLRCPCVSSGILRWRCTCAPVPQSPQGKVPLLGVLHAQAGTLVAAFADFFLGLSTCTCPSLYWQTTAGCRSLWDLGFRGSSANTYARACNGRRRQNVGLGVLWYLGLGRFSVNTYARACNGRRRQNVGLGVLPYLGLSTGTYLTLVMADEE
jgi:hypothetical protein